MQSPFNQALYANGRLSSQNINLDKVTDFSKYPLIKFYRLPPAIIFLHQHKEYDLLLSQDTDSEKLGSKCFIVTKHSFWLKTYGELAYECLDQAFYEILLEENPCRFYMDIDGDPKVFNREKFLIEGIENIQTNLSNVLTYKPKRPVILESSTATKTSFHLLFTDIICNGSMSAGELLDKANLMEISDTIDKSVYSTSRSFRLLNSSKRTKNAPFTLLEPKGCPTADTYATIWQPRDAKINFESRPPFSDVTIARLEGKLDTTSFKKAPRGPIKKRQKKKKGIDSGSDIGYIKEEISRRFPNATFFDERTFQHLTFNNEYHVKLKASGIVCPVKGTTHRNNNIFITIKVFSEKTLHTRSNIPTCKIWCSDPDCNYAIVDYFHIL